MINIKYIGNNQYDILSGNEKLYTATVSKSSIKLERHAFIPTMVDLSVPFNVVNEVQKQSGLINASYENINKHSQFIDRYLKLLEG